MDPDAVWVVSGVDHGMGVLEVHMLQGEGGGSGVFRFHWFQWRVFLHIEMYSTRA